MFRFGDAFNRVQLLLELDLIVSLSGISYFVLSFVSKIVLFYWLGMVLLFVAVFIVDYAFEKERKIKRELGLKKSQIIRTSMKD
jgi:type III secretory pathway component EscU